MSAACPRCERGLLVSAVSGHYCPGGCGWLNDAGDFIEPSSNGHARTAAPIPEAAPTVELGELLDELVGFVRRFVAMTQEQAVAVALWVAHTYVIEAFDVTPFLGITSAEKRSGKTRLFRVLELVAARPWRVTEPSPAVLYRKIERDNPTLFLDETDAVFGGKGDENGLRGLLNAGNERGTVVPRCVGSNRDELQDFELFCPRAFAGIGRLPDTIADRCVPIRLQRRSRQEPIERFRRRIQKPEADVLREQLEPLELHVEVLREAWPELPPELDDRAQEAVEPLLAIADLAGGEWPALARRSLVEVYGAREVDEESIGLRLLADVRQILVSEERMGTSVLLEALCQIEDSPWAEWRKGNPLSAHALARLLRPYGIAPHSDGTVRGYKRDQFTDAWARYLASEVSDRQEPAFQSRKQPISNRQEDEPTDALQSGANPLPERESDALTVPNPGEGR